MHWETVVKRGADSNTFIKMFMKIRELFQIGDTHKTWLQAQVASLLVRSLNEPAVTLQDALPAVRDSLALSETQV